MARLTDTSAQVGVVGGGIVGLATAYQISCRSPKVRLILFEKEAALAEHQTGRNSGVLHSGIYYRPGSLKALNCRAGKQAMEDFCRTEGVPFEICGKVIVATRPDELPRLEKLRERARANGVACEAIDRTRLKELEPHCAGIAALHIRETGIVDYRAVCNRLAMILRERGQRIELSGRVEAIHEHGSRISVVTRKADYEVGCLVNCAGLHSDKLTAAAGLKPSAKIVPFRGEYYSLRSDVRHLCRNLIYPVPDPEFPFLGVHFTRMIDGGAECGPNAVLAFGREAYHRTQFVWGDLRETLAYRGFRILACRHWRMGTGELWRSWWKPAFVKALQRLVPEIRAEHLEEAPAGIRAQAVLPNGDLVDDFVFDESARILNVVNAPSPAATAALSIGQTIAERVLRHLDLR